MFLEVKSNFTSPKPKAELCILKPTWLSLCRILWEKKRGSVDWLLMRGDGTILSLIRDELVAKLGIWVKCSAFLFILLNMLYENLLTWVLMYLRKLLLCQQPISLIVASLMQWQFHCHCPSRSDQMGSRDKVVLSFYFLHPEFWYIHKISCKSILLLCLVLIRLILCDPILFRGVFWWCWVGALFVVLLVDPHFCSPGTTALRWSQGGGVSWNQEMSIQVWD